MIEEAEGTPEYSFIQHVSDVIFERTKGELKIVIYPEEALGYDHEQLADLISMGLLEASLVRMAKISGTVPILELGDLPFLQDTAEDARTVTDSLFPYFNKALQEIGIHATVLWKSAPTGITVNRNVKTLEDWKGLRLRAWSPVLVELSNLLGVSPVQMPYSEAFSALSTGIIDGVYWSPASAASEHTFDAGATHYNQWNIFTMTSSALIGDKPLKNLSPSAQKIVLEVFPELVDEVWENEYWGFEGDYDEIRKQGGEVVFVDPAEIARVRVITAAVWEKALGKTGDLGLEIINKVLADMGRPAYK